MILGWRYILVLRIGWLLSTKTCPVLMALNWNLSVESCSWKSWLNSFPDLLYKWHGKTVEDISQFHSVEFSDDGMQFREYFDVCFHSHENVLFESGVEISTQYGWASEDGFVIPET